VQRQTAGSKFTQRPKISIFTPQGQLVAPTDVKFGKADRHALVRLVMSIGARGGNAAPKVENLHFL